MKVVCKSDFYGRLKKRREKVLRGLACPLLRMLLTLCTFEKSDR